MSIAVVVPWQSGCPDRERAWAWLHARWSQTFDWPITEAVLEDDGPWIKAQAVGPVIEASNADVIVIADADVWSDGIADAVHQVTSGAAKWAQPHGAVYRLTAASTEHYRAGAPIEGLPVDRRPYSGVAGGGIVVLRRETALNVPLDPRFEGWGGEDLSWGIALHTIAGRVWRGSSPLVHLWHPPQPKVLKRYGSDANRQLFHRYRKAANKPHEMRQLLKEVRA